jgi:hypothetical protein
MTPQALMKRLQASKSATLAKIATAAGKSVDDLEAAIVDDARTKLAADVAAGRIDQDEADVQLEHLQDHVADIVSKPLRPCPNGGRPGAGGGRPGAGGGAGTGAGAGATTGTGTGGGYGTGTGAGAATGTGTGAATGTGTNAGTGGSYL